MATRGASRSTGKSADRSDSKSGGKPASKSSRKSTSKSKSTTDHDEIRKWAESRNGHPATVKRTAKGGGAGILRIDFPGYSGEDTLQEISWDEFFDKFDESN